MSTIPQNHSVLTKSPACCHADDLLPFEPHEIEESVSVRFHRIVDRFGNRLAVQDEACSFTYRELSGLSDRIVYGVQTGGARAREPVVLLMSHRAPRVAAAHGIIQSGRILVPLDPAHPAERIREIVRDAQAKVLVADAEHLNLARDLAGRDATVVHFEEAVSIDVPVRTQEPVGPADPAVLIYTSGSTGRPKGVLHSQRNLLHLAWRITNRIGLDARDRAALLHSVATVSATGIALRSLLTGGAVLPFDVNRYGVAALARWLNEERISLLQMVPTLFRHLIGTNAEQTFPEVRVLWLGGETVTPRDVALFRRHFGLRCVLINNLGTTETGSILQYHVPHDAEVTGHTVPIGFPYEDSAVLILDDQGNALGGGAIGEIAVKSRYVALEYWRQPELTNQRFRACVGDNGERLYLTGDLGRIRADGAIEHLGRKDTQIQVRGFRVEVAEVESRLLEIPSVRDAAVVASEDSAAEKRLIAHVATTGHEAPSPEFLRTQLAAALPEYMVPAFFVFHDALPLLPGGKLDRQALAGRQQEQRCSSDPAQTPADPIKLELTRIWEEVFGFAPLAPTDNFFDLGGHSLLAAQLLDRLEEVFARRLPFTVLLEAPTIERLAVVLRDPPRTECPTLVPLRQQGNRPPLFFVPPAHGTVLNFVTLVRHLGGDQPVYGLQPRGFDGSEAPHQTVEEMATHYLAVIREKYPVGPYFLAGRCFGGVVAFEMAQQLREMGEHVGLLAVLDTIRAPGWALRQHTTPPWWAPLLNQCKRVVAFCKRRRIGKALARLARTARRRGPAPLQQRAAPSRMPAHSTAEAVKQLKRAHRRAHRLYAPRVYPGHIVLFQALHNSREHQDRQAGWAALAAKGLTKHVLQGDHFGVTKEPLAREVAHRLRAAMDQAMREFPSQ